MTTKNWKKLLLKIVLLIFGISFAVLGTLHFAIPKIYHEWYNMVYDANNPFDVTAVRTIGLWAFTNSIIAFWAFVSYEKHKSLLTYLVITCFGFVIAHIFEFINGYLPWAFAIMLVLIGAGLIALGYEKK